jgi:CRISPR-associated DxTHG motif protein
MDLASWKPQNSPAATHGINYVEVMELASLDPK